ncbi:MAG: peptidylprolyl isomerase [Dehalococcoidia bacterium]|nr:peptidylprolyl isomerase [Dehalococcoidia bacterium]
MRWLLIVAFLAIFGVACGSSSDSDSSTTANINSEIDTEVDMAEEIVTTASGLQIKTLVVGTGEKAEVGKTVSVHYTGWLMDGTKFDSSVDRGQQFEFPLGAGRVIKGWEEGVATMNVGGKVELIMPPELAYGAGGAGGVIPPNATLRFEVEFFSQR